MRNTKKKTNTKRMTVLAAKLIQYSFKDILSEGQKGLTDTEKQVVKSQEDFEALQKWSDKVLTENDAEYRFQKLSSEAKRVVIAKDVLKQLKLEEIVPRAGTYLRHFSQKSVSQDDDLKEVFDATPNCTACALGAVFVATVRRCDDLSVGQARGFSPSGGKAPIAGSVGSVAMRRYLDKYFPNDQLVAIENAFEGSQIGYSSGIEYLFRGAVLARKRAGRKGQLEQDLLVMTEIMKNIIKNKGEFVLPEWVKEEEIKL